MRAMAEDPSSAGDMARIVAEAMAFSGSTAEDLTQCMQELLNAALGSDGHDLAANGQQNGGSGRNEQFSDDIFDLVDSVARILAEAGADADDVAQTMIMAIKSTAADRPEITEDLTRTMAKVMACTGANVNKVSTALKEALKESGLSSDDVAQLAVQAIAASGAKPQDIATAMKDLSRETGKRMT